MTEPAASGTVRHAAWLAETIRLAEHRWGPYEDADIVRRLRHTGMPPEQAIVARNVELARREGLDADAERWRDTASLLAVLGGVLAVFAGCGAALAALGDGSRPVNLFWALGGLLGLHALTLVAWVVGLLWGRRIGSFAARLVLGAAGRLSRLPPLAAASKRLDASRPSAAALVPHALLGMFSRARLLRWMAGAFGNGWWLLALLSALVTLIALLATRRYGFVWETTLLSPDTFVSLTQALGRLPQALGFAVPDAATVRDSGGLQPLDAPVQVLWSNWLLGCVIVYGILPRLLAVGVCMAMILRRRTAVDLDRDDPALAVLASRLQPTAERLGVNDAAPDSLDVTGGTASAFARPGDNAALAPSLAARNPSIPADVVVGIELPEDAAWPPTGLPTAVLDAGRIDGRAQRNALLEHLAAAAPTRLLVVCDARQTPDRGTIGLVAELVRHADAARVWLDGDARRDAWHARLADAGLAEAVTDNVADATAWLADVTQPVNAS